MSRQLPIDVFFDFICPWCLIGKRQLQQAIQKLQHSHPDVEVVLRWHGVQLLPQIPLEGLPFEAFYLKRLGSVTAMRMRQTQVRQAAKAVGVDIDFERIYRMPNTAKAHSLLINALKISSPEQSERLLEGLFSAYFQHSENIGESAVLQKIATYCGYAEDVIDQILTQPYFPFFSKDTGGKGVPYFVFDGSFAMAGAHPADAFYKTMLDALAVQGQTV